MDFEVAIKMVAIKVCCVTMNEMLSVREATHKHHKLYLKVNYSECHIMQ